MMQIAKWKLSFALPKGNLYIVENNRNQQCCPEDEIIFGYHVDDIADILKHYDIFWLSVNSWGKEK